MQNHVVHGWDHRSNSTNSRGGLKPPQKPQKQTAAGEALNNLCPNYNKACKETTGAAAAAVVVQRTTETLDLDNKRDNQSRLRETLCHSIQLSRTILTTKQN